MSSMGFFVKGRGDTNVGQIFVQEITLRKTMTLKFLKNTSMLTFRYTTSNIIRAI